MAVNSPPEYREFTVRGSTVFTAIILSMYPGIHHTNGGGMCLYLTSNMIHFPSQKLEVMNDTTSGERTNGTHTASY